MISAIVHTKNSQSTLARTLKSLSWVSELVVVDMESIDDTQKIAKKHGATIVSHKDVGYVEPARNKGIQAAAGPWILLVDSDEEIPKSLAKKLTKLANENNTADAYKLPRRNIVFGTKLKAGGWWPDYNIRFFKKGHVAWLDTIHAQPVVSGNIRELKATDANAIIHHHYQSVDDYIDRLNRYTSIEAQAETTKYNPLDSFFDDFLRRLYLQEGYKDGELGLSLSLLQAMYQVTTQAKIATKTSFSNTAISSQQVDEIIKNWRYWHANMEYNTSSSTRSKIYWKVRKWLKK